MRTRNRTLLCLSVFVLLNASTRAVDVWPRPVIAPVPVYVEGVSNTTISLAGTWKFTLSPPEDFWQNSVDPSSWTDIDVPSECVMQGFAISRNTEYPYKKKNPDPGELRRQDDHSAI